MEERKDEEKNVEKKKSKKKIVFITIGIILVILLACVGAGTYYYITEENKIEEISLSQEQLFLEFSEEIKYGQEISYNDLLSKLVDISKLEDNVNIILTINDTELSKEDTYKFEQLGTYNIRVKLVYQYNYSLIKSLTKIIESEKVTEIKVEDKEKPVITGVADKEITVGDEINLSEGITATDNVDGEIEAKIEGTVDNNKAGEYIIKVTATDNSGNTEEASFKVTVKEKPVVETQEPKSNSTTSSKSSSSSKGKSSSGEKSSSGTQSSGVVASSGNHVQDILTLTNQYRAERGASALTLDSKLSSAAQKRATELVSTPSHTRPDGSDCFTVFDEFNIISYMCGENIAWGQANGASAAVWWRNSTGHYANMINSGFHKIGIGVHSQGGRLYYVQLFSDRV